MRIEVSIFNRGVNTTNVITDAEQLINLLFSIHGCTTERQVQNTMIDFDLISRGHLPFTRKVGKDSFTFSGQFTDSEEV